MKTKKRMLSLAVSALLAATLLAVSTANYAERKSATEPYGSDNDKRSANDSGIEAHQKVTICHVPPGNPANAHTIHISSTAWAAHDKNHPGDYLGSCNREAAKVKEVPNPTDTQSPRTENRISYAKETLFPEVKHVITGCKAEYSSPLRKAVSEYYDPITVPDSALDDPAVAMTVANCLDNGDSSDSTTGKNLADSSRTRDANNRKAGGKGQGHDSVSDSVAANGVDRRITHRIHGCQNKGSTLATHDSASDSHQSTGHRADSHSVPLNPNYRADLRKTADAYLNMPEVAENNQSRSSVVKTPKAEVDAKVAQEGRRGTIVSDSAMNDSGVKAAFLACAKKENGNGVDPNKISKKKGDSGHQYRIVESCGATLDSSLQNAIKAYRDRESNTPIVITDSALGDTTIKALYDDCINSSKGEGKDTVTPVVNSVTVNNANISSAVITDRTITGNTMVTGGTTVGTKVTPIPGVPLVTTGVTIIGTGGNRVMTGDRKSVV